MGRTRLEKKKIAIRNDLLAQLERNGTGGQYYEDLVEDYMALWDTKTKLIADIRERGVTVLYITSAGENLKKNDSVSDLVKVNGQMLKLLTELGIQPAQADTEDDEL